MQNNLLSPFHISNLYSYMNYVYGKEKRIARDYFKFAELQKVIRSKLLTTYFQPIFDLSTSSIIGYEALNRPPFSKQFPNTESFYDYIGQTNQAFRFDLYCRNTAFERFFDNRQKNPSLDEKLLFINIHPQVLLDSDYRSGETLQLLNKYELSPNQIVFELTEKKAVKDYVLFEKMLSHYREQGFRIAVDDAGSGYNSLKSVVQLKPEFIKLDKSLIHHMDQNADQQKMVSLLLDFANESHTSVIAEGIERVEDLSILQEKGVHYGQGYLLGKPSETLESIS
ncbi:EAL domain-containing protein [Radiobacillus kanasensis]|uniref:EAL domain-containing protein n=1 Tax=Radiobacillus kanasensis TaxID=2844358 RepID=UPI001E4F88C1|nr:EAL domain-containing protein [Radiobacillus kanasensis]UFT98272.1 EAL domain-containing protein [Radiobacillus kanasensis]